MNRLIKVIRDSQTQSQETFFFSPQEEAVEATEQILTRDDFSLFLNNDLHLEEKEKPINRKVKHKRR
jgi:hypothetical protein